MKIIFLISLILISFSSSVVSQEKFSEKFEWCVATSAHQIEGNNVNSDWWAYEQIHNKIKNNDRSGFATNHIEYWKEDVQLMVDLGITTYRFSVEWAKIEPSEGNFDQEALSFYSTLVNELVRNGIKPFVTLHHFTIPNWLRQQGGWANNESIPLFKRFTHTVYDAIGSKVDLWATTNEPMLYLIGGYGFGEVLPERTDWKSIEQPLINLLKAHNEAYKALHLRRSEESGNTQLKVGITNHYRIFKPKSKLNPLDNVAAYFAQKALNKTFVDAIEFGHLKLFFPGLININVKIPEIKGSQDFIGVNYYKRDEIKALTKAPFLMIGNFSKRNPTDLNWEIYPKGLNKIVAMVIKRYKKPIFITENGLADKGDIKRSEYITSHLNALKQKNIDQSKIMGYCHWSLLDNFEWKEGFEPRFGLVEVNYSTFERTPRPSFYDFQKIIKSY